MSSDQKYLQTAKWRGLQVNVDGGLALGDQKHMQTAVKGDDAWAAAL